MSKRKYGANPTATIASAARFARHSQIVPSTANTSTTTATDHVAHGATNAKYSASTSVRRSRLVHSMAMLPKSSAPWFVNARQYAAGPPLTTTSGMNQTRMPAMNAAPARNRGWGLEASRLRRLPTAVSELRAPISALAASPQPPAPSPVTISSGTVSHTTCDRMPAATPAANAAAANAVGVLASIVATCTASTAARPAMSLSGRTAVNQYNGAVIATTARRSHPRRAPAAATGADRAFARAP